MIVDANVFSLPRLPAFIVIDGVNGAGKSTLQKKIAEYFEQRGISHCVTREPGATALGVQLRALVLDKDIPMHETTELLLFAADRAEHVASLVKPQLKSGVSVISDRYYYSTIAFQGFGRSINRAAIDAINKIAIDSVYPDLLLLLDLDPSTGLNRNRSSAHKQPHAGSAAADKLEFEDTAFHARMRAGFLEVAREVAEPCVIVDAAQSSDSVWDVVRTILERSFGS